MIKNYEGLSQFYNADDVHYEYRQKRRRRKEWHIWAEFFLLEWTSGYGVKPFFFLRTVSIPWFLFGCFYCFYVHKKEKKIIENTPLNKWVKFWRAFWILLDGLNWLPPGVDIQSLSGKTKPKTNKNSMSMRWITWKVLWAFLHSLNVLTPGIDFHTLTDKLLEKSPYRFYHSAFVQNVERLQRVLGWYLLALFLVMFSKIWIR